MQGTVFALNTDVVSDLVSDPLADNFYNEMTDLGAFQCLSDCGLFTTGLTNIKSQAESIKTQINNLKSILNNAKENSIMLESFQKNVIESIAEPILDGIEG